ncbi:MAG TPA: FkbM family methyltransferase [Polyangiales bacterium]|nr:FkbM family methyltransferase [Polyangiales bacterium]
MAKLSTLSDEYTALLRERPICIVDVGARGGLQAHWSRIREHCVFVGFEPEIAEAKRLQSQAKPNELYLPSALDGEVRTATLHHCVKPTRSSLYPPDPEVIADLYGTAEPYRVSRTESIQVTTLDSLLVSKSLPDPDFIKLDTQGSELDILKGARTALASSLLGVESEVEFIRLYKDQPLFEDVSAFLRQQGFDLIGFRSWTRRVDIRFDYRGEMGYKHVLEFASAWAARKIPPRGAATGMSQVVYGDALFIRQPARYLEWIESSGEDPLTGVLKAVVLATELRLYEYALRLSDAATQSALIERRHRESLSRYVSARSRDLRPMVHRARATAQRLVRRLKNPGRR